MIVKVKYFGRIVEQTLLNDELIDLPQEISLNDFRKDLLNRFPGLKDESFKIALNQRFEDESILIKSDCEVAILPPFAGG